MSPLKRKKLSSLMINRDTPILRTVLGQGQADSSQPVSLVCHPDSHDPHSNESEHRMEKVMTVSDFRVDDFRFEVLGRCSNAKCRHLENRKQGKTFFRTEKHRRQYFRTQFL